MEQSQAPQETSIADLFAPDPPVAPAVTPSQTPVEQVPAQVAAPVVEAPKPTPTVPLPELLEQRHARQLAEQKAEFLAKQLEQYQRSVEAQRPQPTPIDPVADPEGFARAVMQENQALRGQLQVIATNMPAHITEHLVRDKFGDAAVDEAVAEAKKEGLGDYFMKQRNPYKSLMEWKTSRGISQTVGTDLNAYKQKVREEVLAELKAAQAPRPNTPQTLPPSLATATNAGLASPVVQDSNDFFKSMMAQKRAT